MRRCRTGLLLPCTCSAQSQLGPSRRARLPVFSKERDSGVFFDNLFSHLSGERPSSKPQSTGSSPETATTPLPSDRSWPQIISGTAIEDEIKAIKIQMNRKFRTPSTLAGSGAKEALSDLATLAMLFGIIVEYDGDLRFRRNAAVARDRFAKSADHLAKMKAGKTAAAFVEIQDRMQDLQTLVSGAELTADAREEKADWAALSRRTPLMQRLEVAIRERVVAWTGDVDSVQQHAEEVLHEAEITGAIAEALGRQGAMDADDADYAAFAAAMGVAANEVVKAIRSDDFTLARRAASQLDQSCNRCHEVYR